MPNVLLVAAGGGGDVIGCVMVAEALGLSPDDASIATLAWERLLVDPVPGPRAVGDFDGLVKRGATYEILPTTRAKPPHGSLLPDLRRDLGFPLFLLDPHRGILGLVDQLHALLNLSHEDTDLWLVDVGGDVLGTGSEPGLSSPLCDALTLAAIATVDGQAQVLIAGPGLDGELTPDEIARRLAHTDAKLLITLQTPSDKIATVLEWHPTEASALLAASAMGIRGKVQIRDAESIIKLDQRSAEVWRTTAQAAMKSSIATHVLGTASLDEADHAAQMFVPTELEMEKRKAAAIRASGSVNQPVDSDALHLVSLLEATASRQGIDFTTFRRLAEQTHHAGQRQQLRTALVRQHPDRLTGPLWRLR